jgi:RND family efflux transporter MFP subunit
MSRADVPAQVRAVVVEIPDGVLAGAEVAAGDLLVRLDASDYEQQAASIAHRVAEFDAELEQVRLEENGWVLRLELIAQETGIARREFERVRDAFERGGAKEPELDRAEQSLRSSERAEIVMREEVAKAPVRRARLQAVRAALEADLAQARINVERSMIRSPIDGILEAVDVKRGENLAPGDRVARVVSLGRIEVPLRLPASARSSIEVGAKATVRSVGDASEHAGASWSGRVARVAPSDDLETRTFAVYLEIEQDAHAAVLLTPGRFIEAVVESSATESRMVIPRRCVSGDQVLLVEDGVLVAREVDVAYSVRMEAEDSPLPGEEYWTALETPLQSDAKVVLNPATSIALGSRVRPVPPRGSATAVNGAGRSGGSERHP